MSRIKILDEQIINHIAAGEVIERPASVVKELVENSLDANSTEIIIRIEKGGKKLIQISDNGSGMNHDDALLSLERHATSKILELDDIHNIDTLGFRGEALPSISAVSEMEISSLPQNKKNQSATKIFISNGKIKNVTQISANSGTTISVKNLFKNVPARKKFLKTEQTEMRHIIKNIQYLACTHFATSFRLFHNGKEILNYPKVDLLEKRISDILGRKFFQQNVIPIQNEKPIISIAGYIGSFDEGTNWSSASWRTIFVNNRFVKDKIIFSAVRKAYQPFTKKSGLKSQLPMYIVFINISNDQIDFNVSPTKTEVRFANSNLVFSFVKDSISNSLLEFENKKYSDVKFNISKSQDISKSSSFRKSKNGRQKFSSIKSELDETFLTLKEKKDVQMVSFFNEKIIKDKNKIVEVEIVNPWQIGNSFIFVETKNGVLAIDQHAAHERILYEKILKKFQTSKDISGEKLLFPLVIDLPKYLQQTIPNLVGENLTTFQQIGFKIKIFSGNSLIVEEIPSELKNWNNGEVLINILQQIEAEYQPCTDFKEKLAQSFACHAAIKVGQKLTKKEMLALINELFAAQNPFFCPHGRPAIIEISFDELRKRFKRI